MPSAHHPVPPVTGELTVDLGIGGYYTASNLDQMFAFDYLSTGNLDHLAIYRPGNGIFWILEKTSNADPSEQAVYIPVYQQGDPTAGIDGAGIGNYPLTSTADRAFAFDYEGSGKLDDLALYCPGTGVFWILQNAGTGNTRTFTQVYPLPGETGIGGYNLTDPADRAFAFDYEGTGNLDDLVLYRPGTGIIWILQGGWVQQPGSSNPTRTYTMVYPQPGQGGNGIGGYNLTNPADRVFAFDCESSGNLDDLVLYRPGTGIIWILQAAWVQQPGSSTPTRTYTNLVYPAPSSAPEGIGGFPLSWYLDQAFAFDYYGTGKQDHLVLFSPGVGSIFIVQNDGFGAFSPTVANLGDGPLVGGLAGFDFWATVDQAFAFDFNGTGHLDHLVFYRPGTGAVSIIRNNHSTPAAFDNSPYHAGLSAPAQVQQNLKNMRALHKTVFTESANMINGAYVSLTGAENNSADLRGIIGFQIFSGVCWGIAAAIGSFTGLWPIVGVAASFLASFIPGMVGAVSSSESSGANSTFGGLYNTITNAWLKVDGQLSILEHDPVGNWNTIYGVTPVCVLANTTFPVAGAAYNLLLAQMTAQLKLQVTQAVLKTNYVITEFKYYSLPAEPPADWYTTNFYPKNPAYFLQWAPNAGGPAGNLRVQNIGTGVSSHYPLFGGDGGMNASLAQAFFQLYDRASVFLEWGVPSAPLCSNWAPPDGPEPPGWISPPDPSS